MEASPTRAGSVLTAAVAVVDLMDLERHRHCLHRRQRAEQPQGAVRPQGPSGLCNGGLVQRLRSVWVEGTDAASVPTTRLASS
jgi:hypothetical protein